MSKNIEQALLKKETNGVENNEKLKEASENYWADYFKKNYTAPYEDGYNSYFRRGNIVEIMDRINEAESDDDFEIQKDIEKVKSLGYDILSPFVKYLTQSEILYKKMREVRDCLAKKLGERNNTNMEASIDIAYDGAYKALLSVLENSEFKEITSTSRFTDLLAGLKKEMDMLIKLKDGVLTKSDEYKKFEKAAMEFLEKYPIEKENKLEGGPKSPDEQPKVSLANNIPIDGKAVRELRA